MQQPNRRRFLFLAAGGLGAAALGGVAWRAAVCELPTIDRTSFALGTQVSITARHPSPLIAERAIATAFAELEQLESVLSIYRPGSQVSQLNRSARVDRPDPHLLAVLRQAQEVSQASHGAFDVTVQPLWDVFAAAARQSRLPAEAEIATARRQVDWTNVNVQTNCVQLHPPSTAITLNGIAQGYASDCVLSVLRDAGIEHALINVGEQAPLGRSARGDGWTVGIQHPRQGDAFVALADLGSRCLATSGDYATMFSADHRFNHIFDPRSGSSPTELASVSVLAPTAMQADVLSTALFVLGADQGIELLQRMPGTDAFFVLKDGSTIATAGFPLVEEGRPA